jgi:hypothetical protein
VSNLETKSPGVRQVSNLGLFFKVPGMNFIIPGMNFIGQEKKYASRTTKDFENFGRFSIPLADKLSLAFLGEVSGHLGLKIPVSRCV